MKTKIAAWTNPRNGEKRVYINSSLLSFGDKVWVDEKGPHAKITMMTALYRQWGSCAHDVAVTIADKVAKEYGCEILDLINQA